MPLDLKQAMRNRAWQPPTADQEALQDPLVSLSDVGNAAKMGAAAVGAGLKGAMMVPYALGAMKKQGNKALPGYIPPGYKLGEYYTPRRDVVMRTAEQWMKRGVNPYEMDKTWAEVGQGMWDYLPKGVRTREQASRWLQHRVGQDTLNPYSKLRDDMAPGQLGFKEGWFKE